MSRGAVPGTLRAPLVDAMTMTSPAPAPACPAPGALLSEPMQRALRRLLLDTLTRLGTLDVTDRDAMHGSLNLLERLLAVLEEPAPRLAELALSMRCGGIASRAGLAACLYRELAQLGSDRFGIEALPLLDD